ncbi:MAG: sigma-54-dependent Fis family transcriptional regulator [Deltaproteobacteria bacterium]|nr:sigma-54-dependent Fis family transcriptional regulator [Deltaproteobacteria bacterium]
MILQGDFREDLFYRLAVIEVKVPSLNQRPDDILPLAKYFLVELGRKYGKSFSGISSDLEDFLMNHHWKGNVRELKNLMERGVLLGNEPLLKLKDIGIESLLKETDIPFPRLPHQGIDLPAFEAYCIKEALKRTGGRVAQAARLLGMSFYTFRYRMKKLKNSRK